MISNVEKLYNLIANDSKKKQSLFLMALNNPKSALEKICDIGKELGIIVTKEEVVEYLETVDDEATKLWLIKARGGL
tara:strand:+ start:456 stop:686 length:231 start_codon:yes stop_codon:yes gene_type:complete